MASLLQGFEEVQLVKPVGKTVLTVTDSAFVSTKPPLKCSDSPAYVKVLINDKTKADRRDPDHRQGRQRH